ncbi:nuclear body protein SP140-like protein isoform 2-T2 [Clarias gariepinus]
MQESTLTDGHWKKDILYQGKTINYLVKKILDIHPQSCSCHLCCPKNIWEQDNDDVCYICNTGVNLVCCDGCPRVFHHHCHLPILQDDTFGDEWICTFCVLKANHRLWIHMSRKGALDSPVSMNNMRCEYLLLRLYKAATKQMFAHDPTEKVPRYSSVISNPMWLDKVKIKLQKNEYRTVGQFVNDIDFIFNNNKTFKKDNWGAKLKKKFEEDFNTIFKIE